MSNLSTLFDRYKALVVFDTETSGLDFDNDQIIELAALRVERTATGGLRIAGKMDTFIKLPEGFGKLLLPLASISVPSAKTAEKLIELPSRTSGGFAPRKPAHSSILQFPNRVHTSR